MTTLLARPTLLTLALAALLITGDGPGLAGASKEAVDEHSDLPRVPSRSPCPASSSRTSTRGRCGVMSVCSFYGVGPKKIERFKQRLRTHPTQGTDFHKIIENAELLGLEVVVENRDDDRRLDEHLAPCQAGHLLDPGLRRRPHGIQRPGAQSGRPLRCRYWLRSGQLFLHGTQSSPEAGIPRPGRIRLALARQRGDRGRPQGRRATGDRPLSEARRHRFLAECAQNHCELGSTRQCRLRSLD